MDLLMVVVPICWWLLSLIVDGINRNPSLADWSSHCCLWKKSSCKVRKRVLDRKATPVSRGYPVLRYRKSYTQLFLSVFAWCFKAHTKPSSQTSHDGVKLQVFAIFDAHCWIKIAAVVESRWVVAPWHLSGLPPCRNRRNHVGSWDPTESLVHLALMFNHPSREMETALLIVPTQGFLGCWKNMGRAAHDMLDPWFLYWP